MTDGHVVVPGQRPHDKATHPAKAVDSDAVSHTKSLSIRCPLIAAGKRESCKRTDTVVL
jgi:hypothetical protein